MQNLISFGDAFIDPELIAWVTVDRDTHVTPAPGNSLAESGSGHGFVPMYVVKLAMAFTYASPIYISLGYDNEAAARAVATELLETTQNSKLNPVVFVQLNERTWVRPKYVGSITYDHAEVTLWLNLPAAAPNFKFAASDKQRAAALAEQFTNWLTVASHIEARTSS